MTYLRSINIPNGDIFVRFDYYKCDKCGEEIPENFPHTHELDKHYCLDCSYINSFLEEEEYLKLRGISHSKFHATVRNNKVIVWYGKLPPWESTENL